METAMKNLILGLALVTLCQAGTAAAAEDDPISIRVRPEATSLAVPGSSSVPALEPQQQTEEQREQGDRGLLYLKEGRSGEAADLLVKAVTKQSAPRYVAGLASILADVALYEAAVSLYRKALESEPDDAELRRKLAEALEKNGRIDEADALYTQLASEGSALALVGRGRISLLSKKYEVAAGFLEQAAKSVENGEVHQLLGDTYTALGKSLEAEREYTRAGQAASPQQLVKAGDAYLVSGDTDKAITAYRSALLKKQEPVILHKLGLAYQAAGRDDEALDTFQKASAKTGESGSSDVRYRLGVLHERKGNVRMAKKEYLLYLQDHPGNGDARRRLADIYIMQGQTAKAAEQYRELLKLRNDNPLIHFKYASVLETQKKYSEAIRELQETVRLDAENIQARKELAGLHRRRGMIAEAENNYREVLRLDRSDSDARLALTALYVEQKKFADLLSLMEEGVRLAPEDPQTHYKLGLVQEYVKDFPAAVLSYEKATALRPDYAKALQALGRLYYKQGDFSRAKKSLEIAKKADPTLLEADMLLSNLKEEPAPKHVKKKRAVKSKSKKKHKKKITKKKLSSHKLKKGKK